MSDEISDGMGNSIGEPWFPRIQRIVVPGSPTFWSKLGTSEKSTSFELLVFHWPSWSKSTSKITRTFKNHHFALIKELHCIVATLVYSSMRNKEWGISREANRREKLENARSKIKHFGSFWRRKWWFSQVNLKMVFEKKISWILKI